MKIVIIYGQNHKGSTYHIAHMLAEKIKGDIKEFFLPRDFGEFCVGCTKCFMESEKKCPHYEKLKPLTDAMDIWLDTNLKAHYFISAQYWKNNFELVKEMLSQAEVYVYENDKMIQGFIGLSGEYIEGIFVSVEMQSHGIGRLLLDYIKNRKTKLSLNVYQQNTRAISFYKREGFEIKSYSLDKATGEKDYFMTWQQK